MSPCISGDILTGHAVAQSVRRVIACGPYTCSEILPNETPPLLQVPLLAHSSDCVRTLKGVYRGSWQEQAKGLTNYQKGNVV
jgi:hypothetical protein